MVSHFLQKLGSALTKLLIMPLLYQHDFELLVCPSLLTYCHRTPAISTLAESAQNCLSIGGDDPNRSDEVIEKVEIGGKFYQGAIPLRRTEPTLQQIQYKSRPVAPAFAQLQQLDVTFDRSIGRMKRGFRE